jgi:hypothetical protein
MADVGADKVFLFGWQLLRLHRCVVAVPVRVIPHLLDCKAQSNPYNLLKLDEDYSNAQDIERG